jgi:hypothetical protein
VAQPIFRSMDEAAKFAGREACECAEKFTQKDGGNIDAANKDMAAAGVPPRVKIAGHECCGFICECHGRFKRTKPQRGSTAQETANLNIAAAPRYLATHEKPKYGWAAAGCNPTGDCPKGWNKVAYYHSHPDDETFSDADKRREDIIAYVTRCPSGQTDRFIPDGDPKTEFKGDPKKNI